MTTTRITLQPAFVLHSRPYRDTSLLIELLTVSYGKLTAVARGVRNRRSKVYGLLTPFRPLLVSFSGKNDLQTLQKVEANGVGYSFNGDVMLCGLYLNELLVKLLPHHISQPGIYQAYQQTLINLFNAKQPEIALRLFEKTLLKDLGYGLQLDRTINDEVVLSDVEYSFEFGVGLKKTQMYSPNNFCGQSLLALQAGKIITAKELKDAKRLLRSVFAILLGNKPLKSRELFI